MQSSCNQLKNMWEMQRVSARSLYRATKPRGVFFLPHAANPANDATSEISRPEVTYVAE